MVKVLGHRGLRCHRQKDENSLPAFEVAFNTADGLETDVHASKENTPFLLHAAKQAGLKQELNAMTDAEISRLRLKKGSPIPKLSELFNMAALYPDKIMDIELKGVEAVAPAIDEIRKSSGKIKKENIILTSFHPAAIEKAHQLEPSIKCGLILWSLEDDKAQVAALGNLQPDYFVLNARKMKVKDVEWLHQKFPSAKIMVWTPFEYKPALNRTIKKILKNGKLKPYLEAIITDHPKQMTKFLKKKGFN